MSRKVAVLGGGLSGLSAAWNLAKRRVPAQVVLYEGSSRVGGWLHSNEAPGGGIQELGPRSIRMAKNEQSSWTTLDMVKLLKSLRNFTSVSETMFHDVCIFIGVCIYLNHRQCNKFIIKDTQIIKVVFISNSC